MRWVPGSEHNFVSSHRSGNLYVWTTENHANSKFTMPINYVQSKEILDAKIFTVRQRNRCPLVCRWTVGHGPINAFSFSPDSVHIAISSQDGFLRIYDFHKQTLYGRMRSYFGGLLCVCWSPDGKYVVTGGEDDLVTVWSFEQKKVVARGEGHKSYINAVAFDAYMTTLPNPEAAKGSSVELERTTADGSLVQTQAESSAAAPNSDVKAESRSTLEAGGDASFARHFSLSEKVASTSPGYTAYRLGSVGQDAQICLWDLSGDTLKIRRLIARGRSRMSKHSRPVSLADQGTDVTAVSSSTTAHEESTQNCERFTGGREPPPHLVSNHFGSDTNLEANHVSAAIANQNPEMSLPVYLLRKEGSPSVSVSSTSSQSSKKGKKRKKDKTQKEKPLKPHRSVKDPMRKVIKFVGSGFTSSNPTANPIRRPVLGTLNFESCNSDDIAPKMHEVNLVAPLVAKKISLERLTALVFREDCILVACHEGFINTWARPGVCMSCEVEEEEEEEGLGGGGREGPGGGGRQAPSTIAGNPGVSQSVMLRLHILVLLKPPNKDAKMQPHSLQQNKRNAIKT